MKKITDTVLVFGKRLDLFKKVKVDNPKEGDKSMENELQKELLAHAEILTEDAVNAVFGILKVYVKQTENKIDDAVIPFLPMAESFVLGFVKKIDGG